MLICQCKYFVSVDQYTKSINSQLVWNQHSRTCSKFRHGIRVKENSSIWKNFSIHLILAEPCRLLDNLLLCSITLFYKQQQLA